MIDKDYNTRGRAAWVGASPLKTYAVASLPPSSIPAPLFESTFLPTSRSAKQKRTERTSLFLTRCGHKPHSSFITTGLARTTLYSIPTAGVPSGCMTVRPCVRSREFYVRSARSKTARRHKFRPGVSQLYDQIRKKCIGDDVRNGLCR